MTVDLFADPRIRALREAGRRQLVDAVRAAALSASNAASNAASDPAQGRPLTDHECLSPRTIAWAFGVDRQEPPADDIAAAKVPGTSMELMESADPLTVAFFERHVDVSKPFELVASPRKHMQRIVEALALIEAQMPLLHAALIGSLRALALFDHPTVNSFSALGIHGMVFLNMRRPATVPFFVDGLVHQGGHVVFSEVTLNRPEFFLADPDDPLSKFTGEHDARTVYEALHGLYTEHALVEVMLRCTSGLQPADQAREFAARAAFNHRRLDLDLQRIRPFVNEIFSSRGVELHDRFQAGLERTGENVAALGSFDWSGQLEEFDLDLLDQRNLRAPSPTLTRNF